jgi:hypothetical protein
MWRYVLYQLPVVCFMLVLAWCTLRHKTGQVSIDYIGAALLILGTVPRLLDSRWQAAVYGFLWVIGLFSGAVVVLVVFVFYSARLERRGRASFEQD